MREYTISYSVAKCSNSLIEGGAILLHHKEYEKTKYKAGESSIGWFRLAELVEGGEKEKALNLYRLLSHSFEDRGFAIQVEGDILWAFEDNDALEKYQQAAYLYRKEKRTSAAIGIYEHLHTLDQKNHEVVGVLVVLYYKADLIDPFIQRFMQLLSIVATEPSAHEVLEKSIREIAESLEQGSSNLEVTEKIIGDLAQKKNKVLAAKIEDWLDQ